MAGSVQQGSPLPPGALQVEPSHEEELELEEVQQGPVSAESKQLEVSQLAGSVQHGSPVPPGALQVEPSHEEELELEEVQQGPVPAESEQVEVSQTAAGSGQHGSEVP